MLFSMLFPDTRHSLVVVCIFLTFVVAEPEATKQTHETSTRNERILSTDIALPVVIHAVELLVCFWQLDHFRVF